MNLQALEELAQWLEAGAPHVMFNMNCGRIRADSVVGTVDEEDYTNKQTFNFTSGIGDCGTICCIAGYAAHAANNFMTPKSGDYCRWEEIRDTALEHLGLSVEDCDHYEGYYDGEGHADPNGWYGHILFDNHACPIDTTPQDAAIAVREVMKGNHIDCWKPVHEAREAKAREMAREGT